MTHNYRIWCHYGASEVYKRRTISPPNHQKSTQSSFTITSTCSYLCPHSCSTLCHHETVLMHWHTWLCWNLAQIQSVCSSLFLSCCISLNTFSSDSAPSNFVLDPTMIQLAPLDPNSPFETEPCYPLSFMGLDRPSHDHHPQATSSEDALFRLRTFVHEYRTSGVGNNAAIVSLGSSGVQVEIELREEYGLHLQVIPYPHLDFPQRNKVWKAITNWQTNVTYGPLQAVSAAKMIEQRAYVSTPAPIYPHSTHCLLDPDLFVQKFV